MAGGAISGQWAYWPVSGIRNFRDRLGKLGPRPGAKIAPRLPRVFSRFAGAWGVHRREKAANGVKNKIALRLGLPIRRDSASVFYFPFTSRLFSREPEKWMYDANVSTMQFSHPPPEKCFLGYFFHFLRKRFSVLCLRRFFHPDHPPTGA